MTAQINDRVFHRKIEFQVLDALGAGLFHPSMHGTVEERIFQCYEGHPKQCRATALL